MDTKRGSVHAAEGKADGSTSAMPQHSNLGSNSQARQEVNNVHNADSSKNHFGNAYYYNTYNNAERPVLDDTRPQDLMAALRFAGMGDRLYTVSPACANTCSWFLRTEEYIRWRDPASRSSHNGVLWIKGKAGTGKSTLMRYIHDQERKASNQRAIISFFFNGRSKEDLARSTEGMYRSLLHQLYDTFSALKTAANQRYPTENPHTWTLGVLEDMFREAILNLAADEDVVCYIDALDECATDQVRSAIACFETLTQSATIQQTPFLICFASRYYPQITMHTHVESKLDTQNQHLQDIAEYINNRLILPAPMKGELHEEIEKRCSGIFLWVVLVVDMVRKSFDEGATRRQLHNLLTALPGELEALFASIAQNADAGFAIALRWVLFSNRPLSYPKELYFAIRCGLRDLTSAYWNKDEVTLDMMHKYVLHVSRGLVERAPQKHDDDAAQLVHESVKEYLLSGNFADLQSVARENLACVSYAKMSKDCQHYLNLCVHGQRDLIHFKAMNLEDLEHSADTSYPFGRYALKNVFAHLESVYLLGSRDINLIDFPITHFTALHGEFGDLYYSSQTRYVAGHSANLLTALIESRCLGLARYYLQTTRWPRTRCVGYIERCELCAAASPSSKLDLSTCCGGTHGSPLQAAVAMENVHFVRLLLEKGANANPCVQQFSDGFPRGFRSPLLMVMHCNKHKADMARLLLDHGAEVNIVDSSTGLTPLYTLLERPPGKEMETMGLLLDRGASANFLTGTDCCEHARQSTALHLLLDWYAGSNCDDLLRLLLNSGADPNITNGSEETPLIMAVARKNLDAVKVLLEYGANAGYRSTRWGTAIAAAARSMLPSLLLELRLHALRGRDSFLPLAVRPTRPQGSQFSQIPAPSRKHGKRAAGPLQYRHPPRYQLLYYARFEGYKGIFDHQRDLLDIAHGSNKLVTALNGQSENTTHDLMGIECQGTEHCTGADCEHSNNHPKSEDASRDYSNAEQNSSPVSADTIDADSDLWAGVSRILAYRPHDRRIRSGSRSRGRSTHRRDSYTESDIQRTRVHQS